MKPSDERRSVERYFAASARLARNENVNTWHCSHAPAPETLQRGTCWNKPFGVTVLLVAIYVCFFLLFKLVCNTKKCQSCQRCSVAWFVNESTMNVERMRQRQIYSSKFWIVCLCGRNHDKITNHFVTSGIKGLTEFLSHPIRSSSSHLM